MKAKKWDFEKREYKTYELPKSAAMYEEDMDKVISCAECGSKIKFGNGYTSKAIHTEFGFGYTVCENCHNEENRKEKIYKNKK
jgi:DNA-directed RNA polymerase subunit RPC12/RpoP